jgi:hypothetical protein
MDNIYIITFLSTHKRYHALDVINLR